MNEIVQHPTLKLHPLIFDLVLDCLPHCIIVAVIKTECLFPTWRELHDNVFALVVSLRRICNDVNVNVPQINTFTIAGFLQATWIYAGNKACRPYLLVWSKHPLIISWVADFLHRDLLRIGDCSISILLDIERPVLVVRCSSASRTISVRRTLRTRSPLGLALSLSLGSGKQTKSKEY